MITERSITDIHTHILPGMDDGSSSVEESRRMLAELAAQGVTAAAATPHFYADRENPTEFFERRQRAFSLLGGDTAVRILPGAEVCYYQGISRTEELPRFAIGQTGLILLEMPFYDWTPSVINEVYSIQRDRKLGVVIAHIDRYDSRKNAKYLDGMLEAGVMLQIGADAFLDRRKRSAALKRLKNREAHFIASDCHNMTSRPPRLAEAYGVIEKKLGYEYTEWLGENSKRFLTEVTAD